MSAPNDPLIFGPATITVSGSGYARKAVPASMFGMSSAASMDGGTLVGGFDIDQNGDVLSTLQERPWRCEDCGKEATEPHDPDCITRAVDEGRATPRERQIARYDKREAAMNRGQDIHRFTRGGMPGVPPASIEKFLDSAIDSVQTKTAKTPKVLRVNPGDFHRLAVELRPQQASSKRVAYKGIQILADGDIPEGEVIAFTEGAFDLPSLQGLEDLAVASDPTDAARPIPGPHGRITSGTISNVTIS